MTASGSLEGRVAIVTGGARGVGAAISQDLAARGAAVIVADNGVAIDGRDPDPSVAQEFADKLGGLGRAYTEDMSVPAAAREVVEFAMATWGGVDIIVNNAAILRDAFIFKPNMDNWDAVIRTNLSAAYYLMGAATPVMRDQAKARRGLAAGQEGNYNWGRIINLVSTAAFFGNYGQSAYAASKGGLTSLTRVAALDMARSGVACNAVVSFAHTRVTESIQPANEEQAAYKERALRIAPEFVATLTGFLCSDAGQSITGQIIGVRGREVMVFCQPRPMARVAAGEGGWDDESLAAAIDGELRDQFAPLTTDLEAFNTDPLI